MKKLILSALLCIAATTMHAQLLYKISGKDLKAPSYILGTYHLAQLSFVDSIPGLRQAMADTQQTYGEVVMSGLLDADSQARMQEAIMMPEGKTLDKLLTADQMTRLNAYMKELLGMDMTNPMVAQQMGKILPSALTTTLTLLNYVKKGGNVDMSNSFDDYFQKDAHEKGKEVGGLETVEFQINTLFKGQSLERQAELLMCYVDNAEYMDEMTEKVVDAYYSQNIDDLKKAMDAKLNNSCDLSPEEEAQLVDNRNADWLTKMPSIMSQKSTLFAVGAGHLPGPKGVLNLLRKAGYKVEPVK